MSQQATPSKEQRAWSRLCDAALAVIIAVQRESGLWALPTSDLDRRRFYAKPGGGEFKGRVEDPFGSDSITVSWRSLYAIRAACGVVQKETLTDCFRGIEDLRDAAGAYGRRRAVWKAGGSVNESARHTAMGLLTRLEFGRLVSPPSTFEECLPTVRWLLAHQLEGGGWAYVEAEEHRNAEPWSTAYCLDALSALAERDYDDVIKAGLMEEITRAFRDGFQKIMSLSHDGIWTFEHGDETQHDDSCETLWHLLRASKTPLCRQAVPDAHAEVLKLVQRMAERVSERGLSSRTDDRSPSVTACVHALLLFDAACAETDDQTLHAARVSVETYTLQAARARDFHDLMTAWDWAVLLQVCAHRAASPSYETLIKHVRKLRQLGFEGHLRRNMLQVPKTARAPILYALSRGQPSLVPVNGVEAAFARLPTSVRWLGPPLGGAALGAAFTEALSRLC